MQQEAVDRERPAMESARGIPEPDPALAGGAGDAELRQLIVGQLLVGRKTDLPILRETGRRDRGSRAEASTTIVDDHGNRMRRWS